MQAQKKVVIILKGISLRKQFVYTKIIPALKPVCHVEVVETRTKDDAVNLAAKAVDKEADIVLAAGGDGTLHQVINGVLRGREQSKYLPVIGFLPIGSANDYARATGIRRSPEFIMEKIISFRPRPVDIGKILWNDAGHQRMHYFINIADVGMGPKVVQYMNRADHMLGSAFAYYSSILRAFYTYKPIEVEINTDGWKWKGKIRTLAIANGKCFGHSIYVAPDARIDDGLFSVFICEDVSVYEFLWYTRALKQKKRIDHPKVHYLKAKSLELKAQENFLLEADGELAAQMPMQISMLHRHIKFLY